MSAFGGFPYPVAALFYVCLSAFTAAQFVVFAVAWRRTGPGFLGLSAPLIGVTLEFLYPNLFRGGWRIRRCRCHCCYRWVTSRDRTPKRVQLVRRGAVTLEVCGGEGGIRSRRSAPIKQLTPFSITQIARTAQNLSIRYKTGLERREREATMRRERKA
jgi:hypothetical protein